MNFFQYKVFSFLFLFSCMFSNHVEAKYPHQISVAAIFQNEGPYLKEWIEYYKLIGVEHFYLYNNLSTDEYASILAPYVAKGDVELIEWSFRANSHAEWDRIQVNAYKDAVNRSKDATKWLAIVDVDEFIVPIKAKNLKKLLSPYESNKGIGGVCIPWVFFGTSNYYQIPTNKLMIESLVLNGGPAEGGNVSKIWNHGAYKSIVRPRYVNNTPSPHYCGYVKGRKHIMLDLSKVQINHYWTKDEKFLLEVKIPRRQEWGQSVDSVMNWAKNMNNDTPNGKYILKFVPELRKRME